MSLSLKISEIQARGEDALRKNDGQAALDLLAANLQPIVSALYEYDERLRQFESQNWAKNSMARACEGFGVKP